MRTASLLLLLVLAAFAAETKDVEGYQHRGRAMSVTIELRAYDPHNRRTESVFLPLNIEPEQRFSRPADFIPTDLYWKAVEETERKGLRLPDLRLIGSTAVVRGKEPKIVATSGRHLIWPPSFQLERGDVIRIFEHFDP